MDSLFLAILPYIPLAIAMPLKLCVSDEYKVVYVLCGCGVREGFPGLGGFSKGYRLSHFSVAAVSREVSRFIWRRLTSVMSKALVAGLNQCIPP